MTTQPPIPDAAHQPRWYYADANDQQQGPYLREELVSLLFSRKITHDTPLIEEGGSVWITYGELPPIYDPAPLRAAQDLQPWIVILAVIFVFPMGVIFLWLNRKMTKRTKIALSTVIGVPFVACVVSISAGNGHQSTSNAALSASPSPVTETSPINSQLSSSPKVKQEEPEPSSNDMLASIDAVKSPNRSIRIDALSKLTNQKALLAVASMSTDPEVLKIAVDKITRQEYLFAIISDRAELFIGTAYEGLAESIVEKITDNALLYRLAKENKYVYVTELSVSRITDQQLLAEIVIRSNSPYERVAAANHILDQSLLAKVATSDDDERVRAAATWRISDQTLLSKIATTDVYEEARAAAVSQLVDKNLLTKIEASDYSPRVKATAAALIGIDHKDVNSIYDAIWFLGSQKTDRISDRIIYRIEDSEVLEKLSNLFKYSDRRVEDRINKRRNELKGQQTGL